MWCEINLYEHSNNAYKPGDKIHGIVKYVLNKETLFKRITVSLKGFGNLHIRWTTGAGKSRRTHTYNNIETYVDIDNIAFDNTKEIPTAPGTYEIPFFFFLPDNIPPTFDYYKTVSGYTVKCDVYYYIRLKCEKPGMFKFDKKFKTTIKVANIVKPTLPTTPVTYGLQKKPSIPFQDKTKVITIKSIIGNSVTVSGGRLNVNYEINNATKLNIKEVNIQLTQEISFNLRGRDIIDGNTLAVCTATGIKSGESQSTDLIMDIPAGVMSMQHSKQVARKYFINIIAELSFPHRNAILKIPVEIVGLELYPNVEAVEYYDSPPSYSEAMAECKKGEME